MKLSIYNNTKVITALLWFLGICCLLTEIVIYIDTKEINGVILAIGMITIIVGLIFLIASAMEYVYVDRKKVRFFYWNKFVKSIETAKVKRLILWQTNFHGTPKNIFIIFDDGTFYNKKYTKKELYTKRTIRQDSWIIIEYSEKRLYKIRQILPGCPVDVIAPNQQ